MTAKVELTRRGRKAKADAAVVRVLEKRMEREASFVALQIEARQAPLPNGTIMNVTKAKLSLADILRAKKNK